MDSRASQIIAELGAQPLLEVLRALQREEGCLSEESLKGLAADRMISLTRLYGVAASYPELCFRELPEEERRKSPRPEEERVGLTAGEVSRIEPPGPERRVSLQPDAGRRESPVEDLPGELAEVARAGAAEVRQPGPLTQRFADGPGSLEDYMAAGGMRALERSLGATEPEHVLSEVVLGGLSEKPADWQLAASAPQAPVIVANCHPGDPLAHQEGQLLARDPWSVVEGVFIAAAALGARQGFLFIGPRDAHLAARLAQIAQAVRERAGIQLSGAQGESPGAKGSGAQGESPGAQEPDTGFTLEVFTGPESLVGSVDSVAAACIDGSRPMPSARPEKLAERGIGGAPALVDSIEVFAALTATMAGSGAAGREPVLSRIFQVTGAVQRPGLYESDCCAQSINSLVTLAGAPAGSPVLVGGLAGQFISGRYLDWPMSAFQRSDNARWRTIHVLAEGADQFELATRLAAYNGRYLCGYCIPCRIGAVRMAELMAAEEVDRELLEEVAITVEKTGLCAPGRGGAAMVMSAIENGLFCRLNTF